MTDSNVVPFRHPNRAQAEQIAADLAAEMAKPADGQAVTVVTVTPTDAQIIYELRLDVDELESMLVDTTDLLHELAERAEAAADLLRRLADRLQYEHAEHHDANSARAMADELDEHPLDDGSTVAQRVAAHRQALARTEAALIAHLTAAGQVSP